MHTGQDQDRLLAALARLPHDRAQALATLPAVLTNHGESYATVTLRHADGSLTLAGSTDTSLEPGLAVPTDGIIAKAVRERRPVYVPDARVHPDYRSFLGVSYPVEYALPVLERGEVTAVINIEREQPLSQAQRNMLAVFADGVSHQLTQASHSLEARLTSELSSRLVDILTLAPAAQIAIDIVASGVGAHSGSLLTERQGRLVPVAYHGASAPRAALSEGMRYPRGFAWSACLEGALQFSRDYGNDPRALERLRGEVGSVVLAAPVGRDGAYRSAISLHFPNDAHLSPADLTLLSHVCRHLGIILLAGHAAALQNDLVGLYSRAVDDDTDLLYQQVLDMAIQRVPGAERGSLLVRRSDLEPFRYVAVCGFEFEELKPITFTDQQMRNWYANDDKEWRQGRTRVLRSTELDIATFSRLAVGADQPARAGDLHDLRSNACLPVPYQGHVLAVLNLDNFTRDDAFAQDSLNTLAMFGPTVASLLAGAQYRDEIVRASRTDPLTGLANREGFRPVLERQHARSAYAGTPYTILSMDLTGFKAVNDRLGHGAGDAALVSVARALESATRPGDTVSRWGGDEFVALLPDTASAEAATVVGRLIAAVGDLAVQDLRLGVDIGAASYLEDSRNVEDLLRLSDARMYLGKQAGRAR